MLFGTIETLEQRIQHMISLRELNHETQGFQCFVPIRFFPTTLAFRKHNSHREQKSFEPSLCPA